MNKLLLIIVSVFIVSSCSNPVYQDEKLLITYLDKYHCEEIKSNNYQLFVFRTANLCKNCRQIPLDTVLKNVVEMDRTVDLYLLFDDVKEMKSIQNQYGNKIKHLCNTNYTVINQYGIPNLEPLLFTIKDKKVTAVENFYK